MTRKSMYTFMIVVLVGVGLAAYLMLPRSASAGMAGTTLIMASAILAAYWRGKNVQASDTWPKPNVYVIRGNKESEALTYDK